MRHSAWTLTLTAAFAISGCDPSARDEPLETKARQQLAAPSADVAPAEVAPTDVTAADDEAAETIRELEARVLALETELENARSAPPKLPGVPALMENLRKLDGPGMSQAIERLLLSGEAGYQILHDFFHQCDVEHEKILVLTHNSQLVFGMLRLIARYPDEVAELASFLMDATEDRPESFIRREMFNFVPVLVNFHRGRFPELRERLKKDILYQLQHGGEYLYKMFLAMRDLEYAPPVEYFLPVLLDETKQEYHSQIIRYLAGRGPEGLDALLRFIRETHGLPTIGQAMLACARLDPSPTDAVVRGFFDDEREDVRHAAYMAYFDEERPLDAVPEATRFLNSETSLRRKRVFIGLLRRKNPAIVAALSSQPDKVTSEDVKKILARSARRQGAQQ